MHKEKLIRLTRSILSQPTAPFHEDRVKAEIRVQLEKLRFVTLQEDAFGNLIARYNHGKARTRYAFSVHMDHPAWVQKPGAEPGEMTFLGGVKKEYLDKGAVQSFGEFAMWNLHAFDVKEDKIYGRACDDLIGCAAMIAMLTDLEETGVVANVLVFFTRAEEVGFLGAIFLARSRHILKNITVLSVETSADVAPARLGGGPIIRVGDRSSIFDPEVTLQLTQLAKRHKLTYQRCLMSGGTCEGTAYQNFGIRTGALCVALANYHNCGQSLQIVREHVSYNDFVGLIELCVAIVADPPVPNTFHKDMRRDFDQLAKNYAPYYEREPEPVDKKKKPKKAEPAEKIKAPKKAEPVQKKKKPTKKKPSEAKRTRF